jgi:flagellar hook-associated protein 1 FlgK
MSNWFAGINQAASGIDAARYGLTVVSQNIANADTPGYTRETSVQGSAGVGSAIGGTTVRGGTSLGGVNVLPTQRADDPVLDARVRVEHARSANADATASALGDVESLFPEPSDDGLGGQLSDFWSAWGTVANDPGNTSSRSVLLQKAQAIATTLHIASATMDDVVTATSGELNQNLTSAKNVANQLADLNGLISSTTAVGADANSLLDQRDQLLDQLSSLVGGSATLNQDGTATVTVGGANLVSGTTASALTVDSGYQISVGGSAVSVGESSIGAESTLLTTTLPQYRAQLDGVADALKSAVNGIQAAGYDQNGAAGAELFSGSGAAGLTVTTTDPRMVAASGTPGANLDGSNALRASQEGSAPDSPDNAYTTLVGSVATATASAQQQQTLQDAVVTNVNNLKSSVSSVNYDEEVSNMLTYQRAFQASSRVLTTLDDMLDTLINHTGRVGTA